MRRFALTVTGGLIAAIVLTAQVAGGESASQTTGAVTRQQVLRIALREAEQSGDPHPKRIEMASGSPRAALSVMDQRGSLGPGVDEEEVVDLVVMHGYFHINGSPPPGRTIPPGKVMELIIDADADADAGIVSARSLSNKEPVALSHLGPVTRLR